MESFPRMSASYVKSLELESQDLLLSLFLHHSFYPIHFSSSESVRTQDAQLPLHDSGKLLKFLPVGAILASTALDSTYLVMSWTSLIGVDPT
jgi:hypothetical protein